jgi:1-aminocyclopropane-1-carboxylate deaminase/D-cysteine desulfhydrase-like pyridoxal-dependent ACC family enzyme
LYQFPETLLSEQKKTSYLLTVGGSTALGAWGYIEAFRELLSQGLTDKYDDVVVTCGSGGTGFSWCL